MPVNLYSKSGRNDFLYIYIYAWELPAAEHKPKAKQRENEFSPVAIAPQQVPLHISHFATKSVPNCSSQRIKTIRRHKARHREWLTRQDVQVIPTVFAISCLASSLTTFVTRIPRRRVRGAQEGLDALHLWYSIATTRKVAGSSMGPSVMNNCTRKPISSVDTIVEINNEFGFGTDSESNSPPNLRYWQAPPPSCVRHRAQ